MQFKNSILTAVTVVAIGFLGQKAQSCTQHAATTGTDSSDSACLSQGNIIATETVTMDASFGQAWDDSFMQQMVSQLNGQGPGASVNISNSEEKVSFSLPAGAHEITLTVTTPAGYSAPGVITVPAGSTTETLIMNNGVLTPVANVPNADPCSPAAGGTPPLNQAQPVGEPVPFDKGQGVNDSDGTWPNGMQEGSENGKSGTHQQTE